MQGQSLSKVMILEQANRGASAPGSLGALPLLLLPVGQSLSPGCLGHVLEVVHVIGSAQMTFPLHGSATSNGRGSPGTPFTQPSLGMVGRHPS